MALKLHCEPRAVLSSYEKTLPEPTLGVVKATTTEDQQLSSLLDSNGKNWNHNGVKEVNGSDLE